MSVENFFSKYQTAPEIIQNFCGDNRLTERSAVATCALRLAKEAGDGIREYLAGENQSDTALKLESESLSMFPQNVRKKTVTNHAGVVFGLIIPSVEKTCIEGYCDVEEWCSYYNLYISGTKLSKMGTVEGKSIDVLSERRLQNLRKSVKKDPTFSDLFAGDFEHLPDSIKELLDKSEVLPIIQNDILSSWSRLTNFLAPR